MLSQKIQSIFKIYIYALKGLGLKWLWKAHGPSVVWQIIILGYKGYQMWMPFDAVTVKEGNESQPDGT
jgi:hypothetical protein